MNPARVGLDARLTRQLSVGMKSYARELAARLPRVAPEYEFVTFTQGENFGWDEQVRLPRALRRAKLDLVHFLSLYVPLRLPPRFVITIHDLIHLRFPQYFRAKVRPYYATVVRLACARAARVITDDARTIEDLARFLSVDSRKVRVVPLGVDEVFFGAPQPVTPPRPYFLYVGNHRPHKDLATLFDAWSALPAEHAVDLYLTGRDDFAGELQRRRTDRREIVALGEVGAERLAALYAGARALAHPSLREGFGLPMAEAMATGCPVVACADSVPAPLAAAALAFPLRDANALCRRLEEVLENEGLRVRLINLGHQAAGNLTWDRCARATADIYREVLAES